MEEHPIDKLFVNLTKLFFRVLIILLFSPLENAFSSNEILLTKLIFYCSKIYWHFLNVSAEFSDKSVSPSKDQMVTFRDLTIFSFLLFSVIYV